MIVQSNDRFEQYAEFEPVTAELRVLPEGVRVRPSAVRGAFSHMLGRTMVLWNDGCVLRLVVDGQDIALTADVSVQWSADWGIVVRRGVDELLRWHYPSPARMMAAFDMTFMDDQWEDFDFGQFVANRAADVARRVRVFDLGPSVLLERYFALREVSAILGEACPEDEPELMKEIRRWWWRWDAPREHAIRSFCSFCDAQGDSHGIESVRGMAETLDLRLCALCRGAMTSAADGVAPDVERVLVTVLGVLRDMDSDPARVLSVELLRRSTLASPALLSPPGTRCSGCSETDGILARGPGLALCSRCVNDRP